MEIVWTNHALAMVNDFVDYIAQDDYITAKKWARELVSSTDKLCDHPRLGRIVPEFDEESLRELIIGNYRIVYRIKTDVIYIEAVWHVRQRPDKPPNT